ncbi:helix-turn-helix transcriptional regulator [Nocardia zapadnayensis]|nr:helix-turn-helix transcriptional regulator [Nocardia zapadnayensis]MCX0276427.1 helix-turn-helix transcriptional regulator [Nocardia zapadnayensis]
MQSIAGRVRAARDNLGWTQTELATQAGLSRPTIARIERGGDVSTATLAKVVDCLGLTLTVLNRPGSGGGSDPTGG